MIRQVQSIDQIFDKDPQYQTTIQLDDPSVKANFQKNKGMTVFTKAFDFARRAWMLKVDIDLDNNVSAFIVERGAPLTTSDEMQLGLTIPIKFSSVLVQFEIAD